MNKKQLLRILPLLLFSMCLSFAIRAQDKPEVDHSYKPLKVNLNEDGSKYVRFIIWHQQWAQTNNLAADDAKLQVTSFTRRSRFLAYAQISPRFLILTHFGLNNFTPGNMTSLGNNGNAPQLFLHDAWAEFKVSKDNSFYLGTGLHYWKGLTRLANQSTLNFMTMDNTRPFVHWHSLGITDQFARHMGVYAKGQSGKFDYRLAINNPGRNVNGNLPFAVRVGEDLVPGGDYGGKSSLTYTGASTDDSDGDPTGNMIVEGYFRYNLWDKESTKLPYMVGTYLGKKKVLALGAGFFAHPNGMYNNATSEHESVSHFAVDAFLDMPAGQGGCFNAYASFMNFNYGENYVSRWAGTGSVIYTQAGYLIPGTKFMPYVAVQSASYDGFDENVSAVDIGLNYFVNGHHCKLTLEYHQITNDIREGAISDFDENNTLSQIRLQAHIFL